MDWILYLSIGYLIIFIIVNIRNSPKLKQKREARQKLEEEKARIAEEKARIAEEERRRIEEDRITRLGPVTKTINYKFERFINQKFERLSDSIKIYEQGKAIVLKDKEIPFSSILSCNIETQIIEGKQEVTYVKTKKSFFEESDELKYSLFGTKSLRPDYTAQTIKHPDIKYYIVTIQICDFSNPSISYKFESSKREAAYTLKGIIDTIIHLSKKGTH